MRAPAAIETKSPTRFSHRAGIPILLLLLALGSYPAAALELRQFAGAAHAFPSILDLNGRKIGDGEFTQQIDGDLLRIRITYSLGDGRRIEEKAVFQQRPELSQKEWSWRELKNDTLLRSYEVDFDSGKATARKRDQGELKEWSGQMEVEQGRTFAGFGFTLALENLGTRLRKGELIELKAVGFTPKPNVVTVKLTYHGVDKLPMSGRSLRGEHFIIQPEIPAIAKLFIKVSDTHIWLTTPPAGFLRWEGPLAEPNDPLVRVDLAAGGESGSAQPADKGTDQ